MDDMERIKRVLDAKMASLPLDTVQRLLGDVATRVHDDQQAMTEPQGRYVALHLGRLMERVDQLTSDYEVMADALPKDEVPQVSLGFLLFVTKRDMRILHGDPQLMGVDTPLNPERLGGLEEAYFSQEAGQIIERHIGDAYADMRR